MRILKSRSTIILGCLCLVSIVLNLATSDWVAFQAMTHGVSSIKTLGNIELIFNIFAIGTPIVCCFSGVFLFWRAVVLSIRRLIWKQGRFVQAGTSFAKAAFLIFVSTVVCPNHLIYKIDRPAQLETVQTFTLPTLAADYYHGDGYCKFNLKLDRAGKYSYSYTGCEGLYEDSSGTAQTSDGCLVLIPDRALKERTGDWGRERQYYKPVHPTKMTFIPIKLGDRLYLVPPGEMIDFAAAINSGKEPVLENTAKKVLCSTFFLRDSDWKKPVAGLPEFPSPWSSLRFDSLE
jgi:hypothetical protein